MRLLLIIRGGCQTLLFVHLLQEGRAVNIQPDHVHLFLSALPSVAPSEIAHTLKGTTARKVFSVFSWNQETALGRCLLLSFVLRGQCRWYERGYRVKIYRIRSGL